MPNGQEEFDIERKEVAPEVREASIRVLKENVMQVRLACLLYGTTNEREAMISWTDNFDSPDSPRAKFRAYITQHPETNLDETDPARLEEILKDAGIRTVH